MPDQVVMFRGSYEALLALLFPPEVMTGYLKHSPLETGAESVYVAYLRDDIDRARFTVGSLEELQEMIAEWLMLPNDGRSYVQGNMTAENLFIRAAFYLPIWQQALLPILNDNFMAMQQDIKNNFISAGLSYLRQQADQQSGGIVKQAAALSLFARKGAPNVWLMFHVPNPNAAIEDRIASLILPEALIPADLAIGDPDFETSSGLSVTALPSMNAGCLEALIGNPSISQLLATVFQGACVDQGRLALLAEPDNFFVANRTVKTERPCDNYLNFQGLQQALDSMKKTFPHSDVTERQHMALSQLRSQSEFAGAIQYLKSCLSLLDDEQVKDNVTEFCECCDMVSDVKSSAKDVSRALLILSTQYPIWVAINQRNVLEANPALTSLLKSLKRCLPWVIDLNASSVSSSALSSPKVVLNSVLNSPWPEAIMQLQADQEFALSVSALAACVSAIEEGSPVKSVGQAFLADCEAARSQDTWRSQEACELLHELYLKCLDFLMVPEKEIVSEQVKAAEFKLWLARVDERIIRERITSLKEVLAAKNQAEATAETAYESALKELVTMNKQVENLAEEKTLAKERLINLQRRQSPNAEDAVEAAQDTVEESEISAAENTCDAQEQALLKAETQWVLADQQFHCAKEQYSRAKQEAVEAGKALATAQQTFMLELAGRAETECRAMGAFEKLIAKHVAEMTLPSKAVNQDVRAQAALKKSALVKKVPVDRRAAIEKDLKSFEDSFRPLTREQLILKEELLAMSGDQRVSMQKALGTAAKLLEVARQKAQAMKAAAAIPQEVAIRDAVSFAENELALAQTALASAQAIETVRADPLTEYRDVIERILRDLKRILPWVVEAAVDESGRHYSRAAPKLPRKKIPPDAPGPRPYAQAVAAGQTFHAPAPGAEGSPVADAANGLSDEVVSGFDVTQPPF